MPAGRVLILRFGLLVTGAILFFGAYWIWAGVIGISPEFKLGGVTFDGELHVVRPWAPWWVMPSITALIGMLLWRWRAQRRDTVSFSGAASAYVLASVMSFMVANLCLQIGAAMQYVPRPAFTTIATVLPLMFLEGIGVTLMFLLFNGLVLLPLAALVGVVVAGVVRLALRLNAGWMDAEAKVQ